MPEIITFLSSLCQCLGVCPNLVFVMSNNRIMVTNTAEGVHDYKKPSMTVRSAPANQNCEGKKCEWILNSLPVTPSALHQFSTL